MKSNTSSVISAGVDGGGTRTRLVLVAGDGRVMGYAEGGSCSFIELGLEKAEAELARVWSAAWRAAGAEPRTVDSLFIGMGSVLSEADACTNQDLAVRLGMVRSGNVRADNDAWNAHAGGLMGQPGILLIAGTGSACVGRNGSGLSWRAGGWGHLLHDVGSAYALGQAALVAATRDVDGRGKPSSLTKIVRESLGLSDMKEIYQKVHYEGIPRSKIAALAGDAVQLADNGDQVAQNILEQNIFGLVEMVVTVACKLNLDKPPLALTGGLISNARSFCRLSLDELRLRLSGFRLTEHGFQPVFGAVILAHAHASKLETPPEFLEKLRATAPLASTLP